MKKKTWIAAAFVVAASAATASAQGVYVYPQKGQTPEQQAKDQNECTQWAKGQTAGAAQAAAPPQGNRLRGTAGGAARGAAGGAAIGAIAGDAGKGAAIGAVAGGVGGRRNAKRQEAAAQQNAASSYDRAFGACMEGRGYSVK